MKHTRVALCIPAYGSQPPDFWVGLAQQVAGLYRYGIDLIGPLCETSMAADRNRNALVRRALASDAEWLYWQDADNLNPAKTLKRLLDTAGDDRTLVSGLYYLKQPPHLPVAYRRLPDGRYQHIRDWERGEILAADAAGMNCVLAHRCVFEDIQGSYAVLQRANGSLVPVHLEDIQGEIDSSRADAVDGRVIDGLWQQRLRRPASPVDMPFFYLEYTRTEDLPFFEMAQRLGHQLYVDTSIECGHLAWQLVQGSDYRIAQASAEAAA